ncbi:MAG: hypothetical protein AABY10_00510 [Nanoarchaeota archaeon]
MKPLFLQRLPVLTALGLTSLVQIGCIVNKSREAVEMYTNSEALNMLHDHVYDRCFMDAL